jgi:hypothetical protein
MSKKYPRSMMRAAAALPFIVILCASCPTEFERACERAGIPSCTPPNAGTWFNPPPGLGPESLSLDKPTTQKLEADLTKAIAAASGAALRAPDSLDEIAIAKLFTYESHGATQTCAADGKAADLQKLLLTPSGDRKGLRFLKLGPSYAYHLEVTKQFSAKFEPAKFEQEFKAEAAGVIAGLKDPVKAKAITEIVTGMSSEARSRGVRAGVIRYIYPQNLRDFLPRYAAVADADCKTGISVTDGIVFAAIGTYENFSIEGSTATFQSRLESELKGIDVDIQTIAKLKASLNAALRATVKSETSEQFSSSVEGGIFMPMKVRRERYFRDGVPKPITDPSPSANGLSMAAEAADLVVDREIKLNGNQELVYRTLTFKPGGRLVIPGPQRLAITAQRIAATDGAKIAIDARGTDGSQGKQGDACSNCIHGDWEAGSEDEFKRARDDCNAGGGAADDHGQKGRSGGNGTDGATVILRAKEFDGELDCNAAGGRKGEGGPGGDGRDLCWQFKDNSRPGCKDGSLWHQCKRGPKGDDGVDGNPGSCKMEQL